MIIGSIMLAIIVVLLWPIILIVGFSWFMVETLDFVRNRRRLSQESTVLENGDKR